MPSGDVRPRDVRRRGAGQHGATYLLLLFMLAVMAAGMATLGTQWALAAQREREAELLFRGAQFSRALAGWRDATLAGRPAAPLQLEELLVDERSTPPRHHLRRLFTDPFTGQTDWVLQRSADGRIVGVTSRSRVPALRRVQAPLRPEADEARPRVGDWVFEAEAPAARTPAAATSSALSSPPPRTPVPRPPARTTAP